MKIKIAYLILAHKNPEQLSRLIKKLNSANACFYVHIDGHLDFNDFTSRMEFKKLDNLYFVYPQILCSWGTFSLVEATLFGLKTILQAKKANYIVLMSGQDYPIKPISYIENYFYQFKEYAFIQYFSVPERSIHLGGINRFPKYSLLGNKFPMYIGSQFWTLPLWIAQIIDQVLEDNPSIINYFKKSLIPDEIFFQTVLLNLDECKKYLINNNLRYFNWSDYPEPLRIEDFCFLEQSFNLFARKFDEKVDSVILDIIDQCLL